MFRAECDFRRSVIATRDQKLSLEIDFPCESHELLILGVESDAFWRCI
jgi:hypothetical protein